ncbi:MAG: hypothetical protein J2P46_02770 [Zavarzinella sp.]|nr:hypothetical protein [Zavarzinella sp.]
MASITLSRYECSADLLPAVCAVCGAPGRDNVAHTFTWRPSWSEARGLRDSWVTRTATVRLPMCPAHARQRRRKDRFVIITILPMLALVAVALSPMIGLFRGLRPFEESAVITVAAALLLGWFGILHFFFADRFQVVEITERSVTLRGVDRRFAAAVRGDLEPEPGDSDGPPGAQPVDGANPGGAQSHDPTEVVVTEAEYQADALPALCARCGAPATARVRRRLRILPNRLTWLWTIPFLAGLIFCPPLFILVLVVFGKRADVCVPMCAEHEGHWVTPDRVGGRLVLPIWSLVATGLTVCAILDPEYRWLYVAGAVLTLLAVIGVLQVTTGQLVLAVAGEGSDVRLKRVHPAFAAAVAAERQRNRPERPGRYQRPEDEWDDYDDEAMERRGRAPRDDWDDEDDYDRRARVD